MTLYRDIVDAGISYGNHESDLYFPATEMTRKILSKYPIHLKNAKGFQYEDQVWFDVPFAYDPFWEGKAK